MYRSLRTCSAMTPPRRVSIPRCQGHGFPCDVLQSQTREKANMVPQLCGGGPFFAPLTKALCLSTSPKPPGVLAGLFLPQTRRLRHSPGLHPYGDTSGGYTFLVIPWCSSASCFPLHHTMLSGRGPVWPMGAIDIKARFPSRYTTWSSTLNYPYPRPSGTLCPCPTRGSLD